LRQDETPDGEYYRTKYFSEMVMMVFYTICNLYGAYIKGLEDFSSNIGLTAKSLLTNFGLSQCWQEVAYMAGTQG
jgi:hypothetical protein